MTKLKAFATHIGISIVIFILLASYIVYFWYPQPFFISDGGWQGLRIIAAVDLVLGPVLTLIVYKPNKPRLKMDLTIIGLVQAAALSWGVWVVHYERPIAAVFTISHFSTVTANDMTSRNFIGEKLKPFGDRTPVMIYSDLPKKTDELQQLFIHAIQSGRGIQYYTEYYVPFDKKYREEIAKSSLNLAEWVEKKPEFKPEYERFVKKYQKQLDDIIFAPWHARYERTVIAMKKSDLSYITSLAITPPEVKDEKVEYVQ